VTEPERRLVFVSGAPGSGKTSLAVPLAAELGFALLRKDRIKEALMTGWGRQRRLTWPGRSGSGRRPWSCYGRWLAMPLRS
jgi:predicted kinase